MYTFLLWSSYKLFGLYMSSSNKNTTIIFPIYSHYSDGIDTAIWMHHMDAYEAAGEEAGRKLHKNVESSIKQVLATTPHETPTIRTLAPHHKNYTSSTNQTRRTLLEKQGRAHKRCTLVDPHTWMCKSGTTSTNLHTAAMWGHGL